MSEPETFIGLLRGIHYASGSGRSKLTPALLDRVVGSTVTGRNWRTVLKIEEMLGET